MTSVLNIDFGDHETHMLGHLVHELHLDHASNFIAFASKYEFRDLLVPHIGGAINLLTKASDFKHTLRFISSTAHYTFLEKCEVCADMFEYTKSWASWCPMASNSHLLLIKSDHRLLCKHGGSLLPAECVK